MHDISSKRLSGSYIRIFTDYEHMYGIMNTWEWFYRIQLNCVSENEGSSASAEHRVCC